MDTLGTNNMMTQETERSSRRRVRIRDKDNLPDSTVPGLPGNTRYIYIVYLGHGSFRQTIFQIL